MYMVGNSRHNGRIPPAMSDCHILQNSIQLTVLELDAAYV
jgi:hypothetical protein